MLELYNTLTRTKEAFVPIDSGKVRMYTCGPTVYNYAHIGNFRAYVFEDLLRRYLRYKGYEVVQVMNITDVDDKIIRDSTEQEVDFREFTAPYKQAFFEDLDELRIQRAEEYPEATSHIGDMVQLVERLLENEYAYRADDGSIYYDIDKFEDYGQLAHLDPDEMQRAERVTDDEYDRESVRDFALWKAWKPSDGDVYWETSLGEGRPGWHIECSTMSMEYLGEHFDIHTGGVDNIFPHHENEIAQSQAATGKPFVNYWLHCEHLIVEGKKMSKSLGNFYYLRDILEQGYSPEQVRYVLLSTHYRQKLNFTWQRLDEAESTIERLRNIVLHLEQVSREGDGSIDDLLSETDQEFERCLDDDLNIAGALGAVFSLVKELNTLVTGEQITRSMARNALQHLHRYDEILDVLEPSEEREEIPSEIHRLVEQRQEAREQGDFDRADALRDQIQDQGFYVEDTPDGSLVKRQVS